MSNESLVITIFGFAIGGMAVAIGMLKIEIGLLRLRVQKLEGRLVTTQK